MHSFAIVISLSVGSALAVVTETAACIADGTCTPDKEEASLDTQSLLQTGTFRAASDNMRMATHLAPFARGGEGLVDGCPQGYLGIFQETTCKQAASDLGLGRRLSRNSISSAYPGCYYNHEYAYFNTHPAPDGTFHQEHAGQICKAAYDFVDRSDCGQGLKIESADDCKDAADSLNIAYDKGFVSGPWTHTPPGCFVHEGCTQNCKLHFGTGNGTNDGRYRAICNVDLALYDLQYDFVDEADCGQGLEITSEQECKIAAGALDITYSKGFVSGAWTHTPPGCFVHKGCTQDCKLHFGTRNSSSNDGNYRAICNVQQ